MEKYPRLLVLANNSFSKSNSNGRTLGSLLAGWPKDRLAQFCLSTDGPDTDVCTNYYCVTDADVLRATRSFYAAQRRDLLDYKPAANAVARSSAPRKSAFTMLCRNALWNLGIWRGKDFWQWIDAFKPEVVMIQSGDSYFMHELGAKIAQRTGAKICIFNTEGYCFFKTDYLAPDGGIIEKVLFPIYHKLYCTRFKRFMRRCNFAIHGNSLLQQDFDNAFDMHGRSDVVYTASELTESTQPINAEKPSFAYIGNLGVGRHKSLIRLSKELQKVNPDFKINVYGATKRQDIEQDLRQAPGIVLHGFVSYDKVKEIIADTDVLVHVEIPPADIKEQLRYAFTTKIADSLSSGRLFLMIAPDDMASGKYISECGGAIYADSIKGGIEKIKSLIAGTLDVATILSNAHHAAVTNHNSQTNCEKVRNIIASL